MVSPGTVGERVVTSGEVLVGPGGEGRLLTLVEPLSFWGGVDDETGRIIDTHHPQLGTGLAGRALLMGATKGSSSSTSTMLECIRRDTAPALLLLTQDDPILVVAAVVAWEMYGRGPSVVLLDEQPALADGVVVRLEADGRVLTVGDRVEVS